MRRATRHGAQQGREERLQAFDQWWTSLSRKRRHHRARQLMRWYRANWDESWDCAYDCACKRHDMDHNEWTQ